MERFEVGRFKLSRDPLFIEKVRDIVGLYLAPPGPRAPALRGQEEPDSGARPHGAAVADAPRTDRTQNPRLPAPQND